MLRAHLVGEPLAALKRRHVLESNLRDTRESFLGQERLMRRDEDVCEGKQARQHVVL